MSKNELVAKYRDIYIHKVITKNQIHSLRKAISGKVKNTLSKEQRHSLYYLFAWNAEESPRFDISDEHQQQGYNWIIRQRAPKEVVDRWVGWINSYDGFEFVGLKIHNNFLDSKAGHILTSPAYRFFFEGGFFDYTVIGGRNSRIKILYSEEKV